MKVILSQKQLYSLVKIENISEQTAYERFLDKVYSDPKTAEEYNKNQIKMVVSSENTLRDFMYSPAGIAVVIALDASEIGIIITEALFAILIAYDIKKWINEGEPNWLLLFTDILCFVTAGFASTTGSQLIKDASKLVFKKCKDFLKWVLQKYPSIAEQFFIPLIENLSSLASKIKNVFNNLPNLKNIFGDSIIKSLLSKISIVFSKISEFFSSLREALIEVFGYYVGKPLVKGAIGYTEWSGKLWGAEELSKTETGQSIIKSALPYINPILGSDKLDPFLVDLIYKSGNINVMDYPLLPIFLDNSKDGF